jgi:hypothetical protein
MREERNSDVNRWWLQQQPEQQQQQHTNGTMAHDCYLALLLCHVLE